MTEAGAAPITPKPETAPEKVHGTTTTTTNGVAAQGEVRGGTVDATDARAKPDEDKKPDASKDKGSKDTASAADKSVTSAGGDKTGKDPGKDRTKDAKDAKRTPKRRRTRRATAAGATARTPAAPRRRR